MLLSHRAPVAAMQFIPLEEVRRPTLSPDSWALWALGFRPFYWVASVFAALSVGLWALQFAGWQTQLSLPGPLWHAHEMVFGYTLAVVVGFLFTAGRNWSGQPTPTGRHLQALVALWLAGRGPGLGSDGGQRGRSPGRRLGPVDRPARR